MMYTATVTSKRQITLPVALFKNIGLEAGDTLTLTSSGVGVLMERQIDLVNKLAGSIKLPKKYQGMEVEEMISNAKKDYWQKKI